MQTHSHLARLTYFFVSMTSLIFSSIIACSCHRSLNDRPKAIKCPNGHREIVYVDYRSLRAYFSSFDMSFMKGNSSIDFCIKLGRTIPFCLSCGFHRPSNSWQKYGRSKSDFIKPFESLIDSILVPDYMELRYRKSAHGERIICEGLSYTIDRKDLTKGLLIGVLQNLSATGVPLDYSLDQVISFIEDQPIGNRSIHWDAKFRGLDIHFRVVDLNQTLTPYIELSIGKLSIPMLN